MRSRRRDPPVAAVGVLLLVVAAGLAAMAVETDRSSCFVPLGVDGNGGEPCRDLDDPGTWPAEDLLPGALALVVLALAVWGLRRRA